MSLSLKSSSATATAARGKGTGTETGVGFGSRSESGSGSVLASAPSGAVTASSTTARTSIRHKLSVSSTLSTRMAKSKSKAKDKDKEKENEKDKEKRRRASNDQQQQQQRSVNASIKRAGRSLSQPAIPIHPSLPSPTLSINHQPRTSKSSPLPLLQTPTAIATTANIAGSPLLSPLLVSVPPIARDILLLVHTDGQSSLSQPLSQTHHQPLGQHRKTSLTEEALLAMLLSRASESDRAAVGAGVAGPVALVRLVALVASTISSAQATPATATILLAPLLFAVDPPLLRAAIETAVFANHPPEVLRLLLSVVAQPTTSTSPPPIPSNSPSPSLPRPSLSLSTSSRRPSLAISLSVRLPQHREQQQLQKQQQHSPLDSNFLIPLIQSAIRCANLALTRLLLARGPFGLLSQAIALDHVVFLAATNSFPESALTIQFLLVKNLNSVYSNDPHVCIVKNLPVEAPIWNHRKDCLGLALARAVLAGNVRCMKVLLDHGVDARWRNRVILHLAKNCSGLPEPLSGDVVAVVDAACNGTLYGKWFRALRDSVAGSIALPATVITSGEEDEKEKETLSQYGRKSSTAAVSVLSQHGAAIRNEFAVESVDHSVVPVALPLLIPASLTVSVLDTDTKSISNSPVKTNHNNQVASNEPSLISSVTVFGAMNFPTSTFAPKYAHSSSIISAEQFSIVPENESKIPTIVTKLEPEPIQIRVNQYPIRSTESPSKLEASPILEESKIEIPYIERFSEESDVSLPPLLLNKESSSVTAQRLSEESEGIARPFLQDLQPNPRNDDEEETDMLMPLTSSKEEYALPAVVGGSTALQSKPSTGLSTRSYNSSRTPDLMRVASTTPDSMTSTAESSAAPLGSKGAVIPVLRPISVFQPPQLIFTLPRRPVMAKLRTAPTLLSLPDAILYSIVFYLSSPTSFSALTATCTRLSTLCTTLDFMASYILYTLGSMTALLNTLASPETEDRESLFAALLEKIPRNKLATVVEDTILADEIELLLRLLNFLDLPRLTIAKVFAKCVEVGSVESVLLVAGIVVGSGGTLQEFLNVGGKSVYLEIAVSRGYIGMVDALLARGADANADESKALRVLCGNRITDAAIIGDDDDDGGGDAMAVVVAEKLVLAGAQVSAHGFESLMLAAVAGDEALFRFVVGEVLKANTGGGSNGERQRRSTVTAPTRALTAPATVVAVVPLPEKELSVELQRVFTSVYMILARQGHSRCIRYLLTEESGTYAWRNAVKTAIGPAVLEAVKNGWVKTVKEFSESKIWFAVVKEYGGEVLLDRAARYMFDHQTQTQNNLSMIDETETTISITSTTTTIMTADEIIDESIRMRKRKECPIVEVDGDCVIPHAAAMVEAMIAGVAGNAGARFTAFETTVYEKGIDCHSFIMSAKPNDRDSPFHRIKDEILLLAVWLGHETVMDAVISVLQPNLTGSAGLSVLIAATCLGHTKIVASLISAGIDFEAGDGMAFDIAKDRGHVDTLKHLTLMRSIRIKAAKDAEAKAKERAKKRLTTI
ncbi:hypothetical protein HK100_009741 [Physocladia obscura]|uniref:F-box domain-containing protein n=1 Tax=Physocladia obscura TaxID=109957 RepID=A0AAD5T9V7_9FUNG|nr:hypothetical protein HK100_009741 [Physocladia obscura]